MATKTAKDQLGISQPQKVTIQEGSFVGPEITSSVNAPLPNSLAVYPTENISAALAAALNPRHFAQVNNPIFLQSAQQMQTLAGTPQGSMRINQPFVPGAMKVSGVPAPSSSGIINSTVAFGGVSTATVAPTTKDNTETAKYKDYSRMLMEHVDRDVASSNSSSGKDPSFPVKLHQIVSAADHEDFITWLPHGRSWRVVKPKAFEAKVIPLYFRHAKYASFMRQVNGWGFKRITQGPDQNSYYHEVS
jgi:hypothetical protein